MECLPPTTDCSLPVNDYHPDCYTPGPSFCEEPQNYHLPECGGTTDPVDPPTEDECVTSGYTAPGCSCLVDPTGQECMCFNDPYNEWFDSMTSTHVYCPLHNCYYDDTQVGCYYHPCNVNPEGFDADGMYCPQNACYHDDTIEGCPNWSCITDPTGMDWHSYNGYCPQHMCYNDDTIQGCPGYIPTMCEIDSMGVDEEGNFCPDHICNQPTISFTIDICPDYIPPQGNFSSHIHFINLF